MTSLAESATRRQLAARTQRDDPSDSMKASTNTPAQTLLCGKIIAVLHFSADL